MKIKKKSFISLMLITILSCAILAGGLFYAFMPSSILKFNASSQEINASETFATGSFAGGNGTEANPYQISTPDQLIHFSNKIFSSETSYKTAYYVLTNNLDMSAVSHWQPIGINIIHPFKGVFDGNGYSISNLNLSNNSSYEYNGLFGVIYGAEIYNLQLNNISADFEVQYNTCVGSLVGFDYGDSIVENIFVNNSKINITSITNTVIQGGLLGYYNLNSNVSFYNFCAVENLTLGESGLFVTSGGFVGKENMDSTYNMYIDQSYVLNHDFVEYRTHFSSQPFTTCQITNSYYTLSPTSSYYYFLDYGYKTDPGSTYMLSNLLSTIGGNRWAISGDKLVLAGVGNIGFVFGDVENVTITFTPNQKVFDFNSISTASLTITANQYYTLKNVKIYDSFNSQNPVINTPVSQNSYSIYLSQIISQAKQSTFVIDVTTNVTAVDATVLEKVFDISSNSYKQKSSQTIKLSIGQTINADIITNSAINQDIYNKKYLSNLGLPSFILTNTGASGDIEINSSSFVLTEAYANALKAGQTLTIVYTNAFPIIFNVENANETIQKTFFANLENGKLYKQNETNFTELNLTNPTHIQELTGINIANDGTNKFLGFSLNAPEKPLDYYGHENNGEYVAYEFDDYLIEAIMPNLTSHENQDYTITKLEIKNFSEWDFENIPTLNAVWGGNTIKVFTAVYTNINDVLTPTPFYNVLFDNTANELGIFSIQKNLNEARFKVAVKENLGGAPVDGFLKLTWVVAKIENGEIVAFETTGVGNINAQNSASIETILSGAEKQTSLIVVLEPKTDIKLTEIVYVDYDEETNPTAKINDAPFTNEMLMIYGNQYIVSLENLAKGWSIEKVVISNGSEVKIDKETNSFTFILSSNDDFSIEITLTKGFLHNLWLYVLIASGILAVYIALIVLLMNRVYYKNQTTTNSNNENIDNNSEQISEEKSNKEKKQEEKQKLKEEKKQAKQNKKSKNNSMGEISEFSYDEDYSSK